jgi:hypothetical protein
VAGIAVRWQVVSERDGSAMPSTAMIDDPRTRCKHGT